MGGAGTISSRGLGEDSLYGGPANDRILARDGARDRANCGRGNDTVLVDSVDRVSRNCENVLRKPR
jgi:hypothetical protein